MRRLTLLFLFPAFIVVFLTVRALWLAYVATLSESRLHLLVFDHALAIGISLTSLSLALALLLSWVIARQVMASRHTG